MAQKPWPVQLGSMALLPENIYSLQASLGHHMPPGYAHGYGGVASSNYLAPSYYPHGHMGLHPTTRRVVGAHHEGWRGAQHVIQRATHLPQPHIGPGGPHALLNEISGQALHRYRAHHAAKDTVNLAEIDARCAATLASAQRLAAALLVLCGKAGASNASHVTDIIASLERLHEQLRIEQTQCDSGVGGIEQLQTQLHSLHAQMTDKQAICAEDDGPDSSCSSR